MSPTTPTVAIVDIGTNSVKLLVARVRKDDSPDRVHFQTHITRLGRGLGRGGDVDRAALVATSETLRHFRDVARRRGCKHVFGFATYALRAASNRGSVVAALEKALGAPIITLSGREEARLAYESARHALPLRRPHTVMVDLGGGSTEVVLAGAGKILRVHSMALGALHLAERFLHSDPIRPPELARLERHVNRKVTAGLRRAGALALPPDALDLVVSGGSINATVRVISTARPGPKPLTLSLGPVASFLDRCLHMTVRERTRIPRLDPARADIIPAGLVVILALMRALHKRKLFTNPGGVREGVLIQLARNDFQWRR